MTSSVKCLSFTTVLLVLTISAVASPLGGVVSISPDKPKIGDAITVTYNPTDPAAQLKGMSDIVCLTMADRESQTPLLIETPMALTGNLWTGTVTLDDPKARYVLFRFVSGEKADDNGGNVWNCLVYGPDAKPLQGAHAEFASFLSRGTMLSFKHAVDFAAAKAEVEQEKALYHDNWKWQTTLWDIMMRESDDESVAKTIGAQIGPFLERNKYNQDAAVSGISWYERVGDTTDADAVRKEWMTKDPRGAVARSVRSDAIFKTKDPAERAERAESYLTDFPDMDEQTKEMQLQNLFYFYVQAKNYDKAIDVIPRMKHPSGSLYNSAAWPMIEKGLQLEKAVEWAKKGVELNREPSPDQKPSYMAAKDWSENSRYELGAVLDTYGYGLLEMGKSTEAVTALGEAYDVMKGEDADANTHYEQSLVKDGRFSRAVEVGLACVKKGKDTPQIQELLKESFAGQTGEKGGYAALPEAKQKQLGDMIAAAASEHKEELKKTLLASRLDKPAVDFTLKDLNGSPVTLSALKGKVVIVDFWATWCGPCKASFPFLQQVYEKYKDNPRVAFLALDTWERQKNYEATVGNAKKFMADNKYTFPVLIDEKIVDKYDVDGIPTKFIVDQKGNVAFRSVGFEGGSQMVDELTLQIELLLHESI